MNEIQIDFSVLDMLIEQTPDQVDQFASNVTDAMVEEIVNELSTPQSQGRSYKRGGYEHVASLPGYPPNSETFDLAASIQAVRNGPGSYQIQDGVPYGIFQELGTAVIEPRPFMTPILDLYGNGKLEALAREAGLLGG